MYKKQTNQLIEAYLEKRDLYAQFSEQVASLCKNIVESAGINLYTVQTRVKQTESLREKIHRKRVQGKEYNSIEEITDLAGVRLVVFFADDVEKVRRLIQEEFRCIHKESFRNSSKFTSKRLNGYIAEQEVIQLSKKRSELNEYRRFTDLLCEVQIKSVLQHAWSEIEHDIWYKPKVKESELAMTDIRQLFLENAKLIKQVEENFTSIRERHVELLSDYTSKIQQDELKAIPVNYDTVRAYLMHNQKSKLIDRKDIIKTLDIADEHSLKNLYELEVLMKNFQKADEKDASIFSPLQLSNAQVSEI